MSSAKLRPFGLGLSVLTPVGHGMVPLIDLEGMMSYYGLCYTQELDPGCM